MTQEHHPTEQQLTEAQDNTQDHPSSSQEQAPPQKDGAVAEEASHTPSHTQASDKTGPTGKASSTPHSAPSQTHRVFMWGAVLLAIGGAFALGRMLGHVPEPTPHVHDHHGAPDGAGPMWTCTMHPQFQRAEPGSCPICGMDLTPVHKGAEGGDAVSSHQIRLSERAKKLARIQTTLVRPRAAWRKELRLLGRLDYDETRIRTVTPWTAGRIDRLHVATTGQQVRQGQVVYGLG